MEVMLSRGKSRGSCVYLRESLSQLEHSGGKGVKFHQD